MADIDPAKKIEGEESLRFSVLDAFFFSLMVGVGETYLPAYALSVGMSEWLTGLFATAPLIMGALIQLIAPWGLTRVRSIKRWVVGSTVLQALTFLPFLYFSISPTQNFLWLFIAASLYWGAGFSAGPSWNLWMVYLVPHDQAAGFFAKRHRVSQFGILLGLIGGGLCLHWDMKLGSLTSVFSGLFLVAMLARLASGFFLWKKKDIRNHWPAKISEKQSLGVRFWKSETRPFFIFLFLFYVVVFISSPFVTPYFLEKIHLSYEQYMIALGCLLLAKIAVLPLAGKLIDKYGVERIFFIGALGISPLPVVFLVSSKMWLVMSVQLLSGAFWGLFEVGLTVIFFRQILPEEKIAVLTTYNVFNSLAMVLGALIGGQLLSSLNASIESYYVIFGVGSVLRTITIIYYWRRSHQMKSLKIAH